MELNSLSRYSIERANLSPFRNLLVNPIYVSILLTAMVMLIVVCIYDEGSVIKTGFYMTCVNMFIVFIHNKLLLMEHSDNLLSNDTKNMLHGISDPDINKPGTVQANIVGGSSAYDLEYINNA